MLNFLNPAVLFALAAGLVPLIIHLLNRKKHKEIQFSTIHFIKQMARKEMRRLKIRQILLLILRTLIILLIVFAFARPTLKSGAVLGAGHASTEAVVIIDNSLSLNSLQLTGNLLEKVRQSWINLEPVFRNGDRVTVMLGVKPLKILADRQAYSPELWQKITRQIQPGYAEGDLTSGITRALDILQKSNLPSHEIYLLSDFQKTGLDGPQMKELWEKSKGRARLFAIPVFHKTEENISIDSAFVVNRLVEKSQQLTIRAMVHNRDQSAYVSSLISLVLKGERVGQKNVSIAPGENQVVNFDVTLQENGRIPGYVSCENDALLEDNRYYFNFFVPKQVRILHLVPDGNFSSYVPVILKPALDRGIFVYDSRPLVTWAESNLPDYDVIVLEGAGQIPQGLFYQLKQLVSAGTGLIVIPGENDLPAKLNPFYHEMGLGQIAARRGDPAGKDVSISMGEVNWSHPIFEGLFEKRKELSPILFNAYYQLKAGASMQTVIRLKNGDPLLMEEKLGRGIAWQFAAPLQLDWTNFPLRGFIVPLFYRLVYYSVIQGVNERADIRVGQDFSQSFQPSEGALEFTLNRPGGLEEKLTPIYRGSGVLLKIYNNEEPGNNQILRNGNLMTIFSVNVAPDESRQDYAGSGEMSRYLPGIHWISNTQNLSKQVETARFGRELWPYLLMLVLLLLVVEMAVARIGAQKQALEMREQPQAG